MAPHSAQHDQENRGRRPGKTTTKEEILRAAATLFSRQDYRKTTVKDIACMAGVDAKLVHYHFGTKRELFMSTVEHMYRAIGLFDLIPQLGGDIMEAPSPGTLYVRSVLTVLEDTELGRSIIGILWHMSGDTEARQLIVDFVTMKILPTVSQHIDTDHPDDRTVLIGTQMLGLIMARYILKIPRVTELSVDEIARSVGPSLDLYLHSDICL